MYFCIVLRAFCYVDITKVRLEFINISIFDISSSGVNRAFYIRLFLRFYRFLNK